MAEKDKIISTLQEDIQRLQLTSFEWKSKFENSNREASSLRSDIEQIESELT